MKIKYPHSTVLSLYLWECFFLFRTSTGNRYAFGFKPKSVCFKHRSFCSVIVCFFMYVKTRWETPPHYMLLAREQWAGKLHCPQHDSPIVGVWNLLVMALFLGLWLFAVEEHRMSFTLFLVICILLWMSNTFREGFWMLKEGRRGYFPLSTVLCLVAQSCPTLCNPMNYSLAGSSVHGIGSAGKNTGVGCHALLQGIFPTQGSNPGLPHCRWIFLPSEPPEKPKNTGVGSLPLPQGIFPTQELNWGLPHCGWILYQLSYQGSPPPSHRSKQKRAPWVVAIPLWGTLLFRCFHLGILL